LPGEGMSPIEEEGDEEGEHREERNNGFGLGGARKRRTIKRRRLNAKRHSRRHY
jgi:hypothetical protein